MGDCACRDEVIGPVRKVVSEFMTGELVDELASRDWVRASFADRGARVSVEVDGPATVLVIEQASTGDGR